MWDAELDTGLPASRQRLIIEYVSRLSIQAISVAVNDVPVSFIHGLSLFLPDISPSSRF